jgi:dephospho-CoA kinase
MAGVLRVGLTGGIACGRSTIAAMLDRPGWRIIDADLVAHALLAEGGEAVEEVVQAFGEGVRRAEGGIDRRALGGVVFCDTGARRRLEAILHPRILDVIERDIAAFEKRNADGIVIVDAALMVETGTYRRYHRLVVAHCARERQIERIMKRDRLSREAAAARVDAQAPVESKVALADYAIDTSGPLERTRERALEVAACLESDQRRLPDLPPKRSEKAVC